MSSFELNKIMGAVFSVTLLMLIIKNVTDIIYYDKESEKEIQISEVKENKIEKENVAEESIEIRLTKADINEGIKITKKCEACHTFTKGGKNKLGPNLYQITSRKVASVEGYKYSKALIEIDKNWSNENLDSFLKNPKKWEPGTKMSFIGLKDPQDRANLILYLQNLQ